MKRYDQNFKVEALKLSDDIGVKKACEKLNVNYGRFISRSTVRRVMAQGNLLHEDRRSPDGLTKADKKGVIL